MERLFQQHAVRLDGDSRSQVALDPQRGCEGGAVLQYIVHHGGQIDLQPFQIETPAVGQREQQQLFQDGLQAVDLVEQAGAKLLLRGARRGGVESLLELGLQEGEGSLELVGGVGAEAARLMERLLQPVEHAVENGDEPLEFAVVGRSGDASVEALRVDALGGARERGHRAERTGGEPPGGKAHDHEDQRQDGQEPLAQADEVLVGVVEIGRQHKGRVRVSGDEHAPAAAPGRQREQARVTDRQRRISGGKSLLPRGRRRILDHTPAFVGFRRGELLGAQVRRPAGGSIHDAIKVFHPDDIARRVVAARDDSERRVQPSPMAGVGHASEIGAGDVLQVALEALNVEIGGEVPRQKGGGEQHRGRGKPDEQGESDPERSHAPARWEAGTARAR